MNSMEKMMKKPTEKTKNIKISKTKKIILLDYNTNQDVDDPSKPLSHAFLIKAYIEGLYPYGDIKEDNIQKKELTLFGW